MRNAILNNYNIEVHDLEYIDGNYHFADYILVVYKKDIDLSIYKYLKDNNYPIYEIVWNKDSKYVTKIGEKEYVLFKSDHSVEVTFNELERFLIPTTKMDIVPWNQYWEEKIDYLEEHIKTIEHYKLRESFFYYMGLTENAILFYKSIKKAAPLYISHSRLNKKEDFSNPMNFVLDYKVRDVAEYTKRLFFEERLNIDDLYLFFSENNFTETDYQLFYARLLYPSYYFDCYDNLVNGYESNLDRVIGLIEKYEIFLKDLYNEISKYITIPKIDWLIK